MVAHGHAPGRRRRDAGEVEHRTSGVLVADRPGTSNAYALFNLQDRATLFIGSGVTVYEGMIVGEHSRDNDLDVNPCREKKLTNMRAAGRDDNVILTPVTPPSLEQALRFIREDELVEVTPRAVRMRKAVLSAVKRHTLRSSKLKNKKAA